MTDCTPVEIDELRYAARNHGRAFLVTGPFAVEDAPQQIAVRRLTERGLLQDCGPSASGRWRELTPLGRATLRALGERGKNNEA